MNNRCYHWTPNTYSNIKCMHYTPRAHRSTTTQFALKGMVQSTSYQSVIAQPWGLTATSPTKSYNLLALGDYHASYKAKSYPMSWMCAWGKLHSGREIVGSNQYPASPVGALCILRCNVIMQTFLKKYPQLEPFLCVHVYIVSGEWTHLTCKPKQFPSFFPFPQPSPSKHNKTWGGEGSTICSFKTTAIDQRFLCRSVYSLLPRLSFFICVLAPSWWRGETRFCFAKPLAPPVKDLLCSELLIFRLQRTLAPLMLDTRGSHSWLISHGPC